MGLHGPAVVGGVGEADLLGYGFQVEQGVVQQFIAPANLLPSPPVQTEHACSCLHNGCANIAVDILFAQ